MAINPALLGAVANQAGAVVPGAPGTLSLSAGSPADSVIGLSWSAPSDNGGGTISGYKIQKKTTGSWSDVVADTGSTATTYSNTGLTYSTTYYYRVAAINEKGVGVYGNEPSIATSDAFITATGGTITTYSGYKVHTFTGSGTFQITANVASKTFDVMVVGGGGGGNSANVAYFPSAAGGGGGGGVRTLSGQTGTVTSYTVTIGSGGASASAGGTTSLASSSVAGGARGSGNTGGDNAPTGGGGGGGGVAFWFLGGQYNYSGGTGSTYGYSGAWSLNNTTNGNVSGGGGGGGAGAVGLQQGNGGNGLQNAYRTGSNVYYGGGGAGAAAETGSSTPTLNTGGSGGGGNGGRWNQGGTDVNPENGDANTGGGAGGSMTNFGTGKAGGSGIVVIRYAN
jgi:hypothetical protein